MLRGPPRTDPVFAALTRKSVHDGTDVFRRHRRPTYHARVFRGQRPWRSAGASAPTDAKGEVELELHNEGLNVIAVDHDVKLEGDPQADEIGHTAGVRFVAEALSRD